MQGNDFIRTFTAVQALFFLLSLTGVALCSGFSRTFVLSFLLGYCAVVLDFALLARFSSKAVRLILEGRKVRSQLFFRLAVVGAVLLAPSVFTGVNFFAIILAVVVASAGLFASALKYQQERERWNTEA